MFKDIVRQYIEAYVTASRRDGSDLFPWLSRAPISTWIGAHDSRLE